jgi:hypothetical protein
MTSLSIPKWEMVRFPNRLRGKPADRVQNAMPVLTVGGTWTVAVRQGRAVHIKGRHGARWTWRRKWNGTRLTVWP